MPPGLPSPARPFTLARLARLLAACALLAAGPAFADDYADVGRLLQVGRDAEALVRADAYLATQPRDPQMRFLRARALAGAGRTDEAIAALQQLTQDYPELAEPYNNLAVLYAGRDQLDQARSALESAIRANPSYAVAHENLGDVLARLAQRSWLKAQQLDPALRSAGAKAARVREALAPPAAPTAAPQPPAAPR